MICTSKSTVALRSIFYCHNILCMYESMRPEYLDYQNTTQLLANPLATHNTCRHIINSLTYYTTLDFVLVFQRDTLRLALFLNHGYYLYLSLTIERLISADELRFVVATLINLVKKWVVLLNYPPLGFGLIDLSTTQTKSIVAAAIDTYLIYI